MPNEIDVVLDISARLEKAAIAYMLTGSIAMNYYAEPRMTRDIDLVVALRSGDVDKVLQLFGSDYYVSREAVESSIAHQSLFNAIHQATVIKVDCIIRKQSAYRLEEFRRRQSIQLAGSPVWIVSREDLIISKLEWAKDSHSELQLRDVRNLAAGGFDRDYVKDWTERLDLATLWKECWHD
jgi:hypothetical protein